MERAALTHFCVCVQREQPGGMRSGAVFRAGHGDSWEGFLSRAERRRRERARHRRKQGGVHQVKESEKWEIVTRHLGSQQKLASIPSFSLLTNWRFTRGVKEQTRAFLDGFNEVVPLEWLRYFDEKELEVRTVELGGLKPRPPRSFSKNSTAMTLNLQNAFSWPKPLLCGFYFIAI